VRFEVLKASSMEMRVFRDIVPCRLAVIVNAVCTCETSVYSSYTKRRYIPEECHLHPHDSSTFQHISQNSNVCRTRQTGSLINEVYTDCTIEYLSFQSTDQAIKLIFKMTRSLRVSHARDGSGSVCSKQLVPPLH
jgi:hypothetical protein